MTLAEITLAEMNYFLKEPLTEEELKNIQPLQCLLDIDEIDLCELIEKYPHSRRTVKFRQICRGCPLGSGVHNCIYKPNNKRKENA